MPEQLRVWIRLSRPFSLTASIVPVLVGASLALLDGYFDGVNLVLMLVASLLIQAATNMFNEYYDYRRGLDDRESVGIAGVIVEGSVTARTVLAGALGCFAVALFLGLILVVRTGWPVLAVGLLSAFLAFVYSGGPKPIAYTAFGELEVFIAMGLIQVGLSYYIHTLTLTGRALWASLPVGCLVAAILLGNNIRDRRGDAERGRATFVIVFGRPAALGFLAALLLGAYLTAIVGVLAGLLPWPALLVIVTAPVARKVWLRFTSADEPRLLHPAVKLTAGLHAQYGLVYALALAGAAALR